MHEMKLSLFVKTIAPIIGYIGISKEMLPKRIILYLAIHRHLKAIPGKKMALG